jgi:hypothetical protein
MPPSGAVPSAADPDPQRPRCLGRELFGGGHRGGLGGARGGPDHRRRRGDRDHGDRRGAQASQPRGGCHRRRRGPRAAQAGAARRARHPDRSLARATDDGPTVWLVTGVNGTGQDHHHRQAGGRRGPGGPHRDPGAAPTPSGPPPPSSSASGPSAPAPTSSARTRAPTRRRWPTSPTTPRAPGQRPADRRHRRSAAQQAAADGRARQGQAGAGEAGRDRSRRPCSSSTRPPARTASPRPRPSSRRSRSPGSR